MIWRLHRPNKGAKGSGTTGPQGPIGPKGDKGDQGNIGPAGETGPKGEVGATGSTGSPGPKGDTGAAGAAGAVGPQGPKGDAGATGATGPKGDTGAQGPVGPAGPSKRIVTATLTTNASGVASLTYSPAFAATPNVHCELTVPANNRQAVRLTASTATGCTVLVEQRNAVLLSLLGIDILAAGVTLVSGASVRVTVFEV